MYSDHYVVINMNTQMRVEGIDGLYIFDDIITNKEEVEIMIMIDDMQKEGSSIRNKISTRLTMHFGHTFSAKTLRIDFDDQPPEIPEKLKNFIDDVIKKIHLITNL